MEQGQPPSWFSPTTMGFYGSICLAMPKVDLPVKQSEGGYTLTRLTDGIANYTASSKDKNWRSRQICSRPLTEPPVRANLTYK